MKALLVIDHGSRLKTANDMLFDVVDLLRSLRPDIIVHGAHMELADPTILDGFKKCVDDGATEVIAHPYMLSEGRHAQKDIPRLVNEAAEHFPDVLFTVTPPLGVHSNIANVIFERAQL